MGLHPKQINMLRRQLLRERADLLKQLELNEQFGFAESQSDYTREFSMYDNHPGDVATETYEREKDLALHEHFELRLEDIDRALENMEIGHYGTCADCGKTIPFLRLRAYPTAQYCVEHTPDQSVSNRRPVEETFLQPPFGRTSLDERDDNTQFDGEDAWQIVESWGNSDSPAYSENRNVDSYDEVFIESDDHDGYVEAIESFIATDIYGKNITVVRNDEYHRYMALDEGDHDLEVVDAEDENPTLRTPDTRRPQAEPAPL